MIQSHRARFAGVLALATLLSACAAAGRPAEAPRASGFAARVDSLAPVLLRETSVPGIAIGIVEHGQVVATRGYGVADRASGRPMTARTLFNFASVSKPVTAWGVLRLAERGALPLDAPVNTLLRGWQVPASEFGTDGVTARRLLSHTAGLSVPSMPFFPVDTVLPTRERVLAGQAGDRGPVRVERQPGERWMYSGGGYTILELLVEEASGRAFAEYMRESVFQPLGMERTTFAPAAVSGGDVATPYDDQGNPVAPYRLAGAAAGGMYSSVEDFARFMAAYTAPNRILRPETFQAMLTPVADVRLDGIADDLDVSGARYGLGHGVHRTPTGERVVYHSGGNPGYIAYFLVMPERGIGMVMAINGGDGGVAVVTRLLQLWSQHYGVPLQPIY
jgi:CubicO group peptidase (beta-lactamase class C family)